MKSLLSVALMTASILCADDRLAVGSRPLSAAAEQQFAAELPLQEDNVPDESAGFFSNSAANHWLAFMHSEGPELEDGSVWTINFWDRDALYAWQPFDPLVITQNSYRFSAYKYRIINRNTGSSLAANLSLSPLLQSEHARFVSGIDISHGEIILTDASRWIIPHKDDPILNDWRLNDVIIIGFNSDQNVKFDRILINVNMNNYVRAKQF